MDMGSIQRIVKAERDMYAEMQEALDKLHDAQLLYDTEIARIKKGYKAILAEEETKAHLGKF